MVEATVAGAGGTTAGELAQGARGLVLAPPLPQVLVCKAWPFLACGVHRVALHCSFSLFFGLIP
jgi:hypothetical protein